MNDVEQSEQNCGTKIDCMHNDGDRSCRLARHTEKHQACCSSGVKRAGGASKVTGTLKGTILAGYKILWTVFRYTWRAA